MRRSRALSRWLASGLLVASIGTSCDSTVRGTPAAGRPDVARASTNNATSTGGPTPTGGATSTAHSPRPSKTPPPTHSATAADGTDIAACADGNCEILLTGPADIPLHGHGGVNVLRVTRVSAAGISFSSTAGDGETSGSVSEGCIIAMHPGALRTVCGSGLALPRPPAGELLMQLESTSHAGAVLRIASR